MLEKVPFGHGYCVANSVPFGQKKPAGQGLPENPVLPSRQKWPSAQGVQEVCPVRLLYVPAMHGVGIEVPAAQVWPAGHTSPPTSMLPVKTSPLYGKVTMPDVGFGTVTFRAQ